MKLYPRLKFFKRHADLMIMPDVYWVDGLILNICRKTSNIDIYISTCPHIFAS
jgi:hypothetical protein